MQRNCREAKSSKSGQKASQKVKKKSPAGKHRPSTAPTPTKGDKQVKRDAKSSRKPEKLDSSKVNRPNKNHLGDVYRDLYPEYLDTMFALIEKGFFWSHAADDDVSMEWDVARASPSTEPTMAWLQKDHQNVGDNVFESSAMLDDGEEFPVVELPSDAIFQSSLEEASRQECSPGLRTSAASLPGVDPGIVHAEMTGVLSDEEEGGAHLMDDTLTIADSEEDSRIPILCINLLQDADARARENDRVLFIPPEGEEHKYEGRHGLAFLLDVKDRVEEIHRKEPQHSSHHHMGALERQEFLFDKGAVLSVSDDSQGSEDAKSVFSARSNEAVVSGRINSKRALSALRGKMIREGRSKREIDFEIKGRMPPEDAAAQQRRCREVANKYILKKKDKIDKEKKKHTHRTARRSSTATTASSGGVVLSEDAPSVKTPMSPEAKEKPAESVKENPETSEIPPSIPEPSSTSSVVVAAESLSPPRVEGVGSILQTSSPQQGFIRLKRTTTEEVRPVKRTDIGNDEEVEGPVLGLSLADEFRQSMNDEIQKLAKTYSRDQRVVIHKRQKEFTALLVEIQKKYHRGGLTEKEFNEQKEKVLNGIFDTDVNGRVSVKESTPEGLMETRKRVRSSEMDLVRRRGRRAFRMPGWNTGDDTDAALEEDDDGIYYDDDNDDEDDEVSDVENGSWVAICHDYPIPTLMPRAKRRMLVPKGGTNQRKEMNAILGGPCRKREEERRRRNLERREMLMRKFDQRAPPGDRMFHQDTSFRLDGKPTPKEEQDWALWNTPTQDKPDWMRTTGERQGNVIFPEDMKKLVS